MQHPGPWRPGNDYMATCAGRHKKNAPLPATHTRVAPPHAAPTPRFGGLGTQGATFCPRKVLRAPGAHVAPTRVPTNPANLRPRYRTQAPGTSPTSRPWKALLLSCARHHTPYAWPAAGEVVVHASGGAASRALAYAWPGRREQARLFHRHRKCFPKQEIRVTSQKRLDLRATFFID